MCDIRGNSVSLEPSGSPTTTTIPFFSSPMAGPSLPFSAPSPQCSVSSMEIWEKGAKRRRWEKGGGGGGVLTSLIHVWMGKGNKGKGAEKCGKSPTFSSPPPPVFPHLPLFELLWRVAEYGPLLLLPLYGLSGCQATTVGAL